MKHCHPNEIIRVDLSAHFNLMVDIRNRRLVDPMTSVSTRCQAEVADVPFSRLVGTSAYLQLLTNYSEVTRLTVVKHSTVHRIPRVRRHGECPSVQASKS